MTISKNQIKKRARLMRVFFIKSFKVIINTLFPIECCVCGKEDVWTCDSCIVEIKSNSISFCPACGSGNNYFRFCEQCRKKFHLEGVWIASEYKNKQISHLIKSMKYGFAKEVGNSLALFLSFFLEDLFRQASLSSFLSGNEFIPKKFQAILKTPKIMTDALSNTIIIPVPLHIRRMKWRGFNQSEIIAQELSKITDIATDNKNLIKTKNNRPQTKLMAADRKQNAKDAYAWQGKNIKNKNIILLDDVCTTGATLNECAKVLKKNGAGEIWGLVLAKN